MPVSEILRRSPRLYPSPKPNSVSENNPRQPLALALCDDDELTHPKPLKIHHPRSQKSYLRLHAPSSALRRSPRLSGASEGQRRSQLLMGLPEKKVCELGSRDIDLTPAPVNRKRKFHSEEMSMNWDSVRRSPRFSGEKVEGLVRKSLGKAKKLDSRQDCPENRGSVRRSSKFSGQESIDDSNGKMVGALEDVPLALASSTMSEKRGKLRYRKSSRRFSGMETVKASTRKNVILRLPSPSMAGKSGRLQKLDSQMPSSEFLRRSPRFSDQEEPNVILRQSPKLSEETPASENESGGNFEIVPFPSMKSIMEEIFGNFEEDRVLRRSPRGLSSISLVDDYECDEMKELSLPISTKKKKKKEKTTKESREKMNVSSSSHFDSSIDNKERSKSRSCSFVGDAVPQEEAHQRWQWRYQLKNRRPKGRSLKANDEEDEPIFKVKCHYNEAHVKGCTFHLGDCALIRGEDRQEHIGRIMEFFQTIEGEDYFRCQWFYKAEDTVMKDAASFHDKKRVFYSTIMNDNLLDCIISKLNVVQVTPELILKAGSIPPSDFYYDMEYCLDYSTFRNLPRDNSVKGFELSSISCPEPVLSVTGTFLSENTTICEPCNPELSMLDIYAGCGGMSTGLCIGAKLSGANLVTRWAIDFDSWACESLRLNHPETHVKNEAAEDFLELLKHWEKLCKKFVTEDVETHFPSAKEVSEAIEINSDAQSDEELEVLRLVDISYGDNNDAGKRGLKFKVRWKGYDQSEDTWEPLEGLSNCQDLIQEFVINGFKNKVLPLPGDVDVICGGPPCQGISGYNRFRCVDDPLSDERNHQLVVFMDIVEYLKPKFVLMENVTDILRFDKGSLGRYALSRLVHINYQARVGIMAAGCYGLPQFRLRVFFWAAIPSEELPQFPFPTHDVIVRYGSPSEFERNVVGYEEGQPPELEDAVLLSDAFSDLPVVTNFESLDEMPYNKPPETEFQKYIRSINCGSVNSGPRVDEGVLYDHRPHQLFEDDYIRVCRIPRRKGANFRDLPGIIVGDDNVVRRDPAIKTELLPSGRPMVPDYAFTFEQGKSKRPFGRLWWDETMTTVITYPNCHNQVVLHPEQDRVLTVRECARLQGFPDNYRFCGTVKKRYRQVGNAVAIPVAKALGYSLGMASQKLIGKEHLMTLPPKFAYSNHL